eukprot:TRINITY_DN37919_c0_g1_i3.p1 TRINITY_DN37919_c0_g1~~TRINITY_DN37919_c0_g1_i3.p1  ORF type:complete len:562 (+),score=117.61 TRINITY_DN37919_c0_g1_i3:136-1821(+)
MRNVNGYFSTPWALVWCALIHLEGAVRAVRLAEDSSALSQAPEESDEERFGGSPAHSAAVAMRAKNHMGPNEDQKAMDAFSADRVESVDKLLKEVTHPAELSLADNYAMGSVMHWDDIQAYKCDPQNRAPCQKGKDDKDTCSRKQARCDSDLFEAKIEGPWIPCCEKQNLFALLVWFNNVMRKYVVSSGSGFWFSLVSGTLLGSVRSADIVDWDTDIDIVIPAEFESWLKLILREHIAESGMRPRYELRGPYPDYNAPLRLYLGQENHAHIDIWTSDVLFFNDDGTDAAKPACMKIGNDVLPQFHMFPLKQCKIQQAILPCFADSAAYLDWVYGKGWRAPGTEKSNPQKPPIPPWCERSSLFSYNFSYSVANSQDADANYTVEIDDGGDSSSGAGTVADNASGPDSHLPLNQRALDGRKSALADLEVAAGYGASPPAASGTDTAVTAALLPDLLAALVAAGGSQQLPGMSQASMSPVTASAPGGQAGVSQTSLGELTALASAPLAQLNALTGELGRTPPSLVQADAESRAVKTSKRRSQFAEEQTPAAQGAQQMQSASQEH